MTEHPLPLRVWRKNTVDGRLAIVRMIWEDGLTASQLAERAARFTGEDVSRSAITGIFLRYRDRLHPCRLNPAVRAYSLGGKRSAAKRTAEKGKAVASKAAPEWVEPHIPGQRATVGRPLADLDFGDCRYAVASDESRHLFCGQAVHKRGCAWCGEHYWLVYRGRVAA